MLPPRGFPVRMQTLFQGNLRPAFQKAWPIEQLSLLPCYQTQKKRRPSLSVLKRTEGWSAAQAHWTAAKSLSQVVGRVPESIYTIQRDEWAVSGFGSNSPPPRRREISSRRFSVPRLELRSRIISSALNPAFSPASRSLPTAPNSKGFSTIASWIDSAIMSARWGTQKRSIPYASALPASVPSKAGRP
jgi:hypothetical protein